MTRKELIEAIYSRRSFLCVGLDTDTKKLPAHLQSEPDAIFTFNRAIIDATAPYCVAYKPNLAFYEAAGVHGLEALDRTVKYLRDNYPTHLVIADAKRGDIGNTAALYARAFFDEMGFDALTVAPYMGKDSVTPFMGRPGRWVVLLALTSNPGSADFQNFCDAEGTPLWQRVIATSQTWCTNPEEEMMYVVGATRADMLDDVRRVAPRQFLLVPGVGAQGGSLEEVAKHGMIPGECGLLVNSSRGIIYASQGEDFAEAAAREAAKLATEMDKLLK